jgi:hypothetical protein
MITSVTVTEDSVAAALSYGVAVSWLGPSHYFERPALQCTLILPAAYPCCNMYWPP